MLLKSIVRKTLGVKRHLVKEVDFLDGMVIIKLDIRKGWKQPCGTCGAMSRVRDRLQSRSWRHAPLWGMAVTMMYAPARVSCPRCGKVRVEAIPWSQGKSRLSVGLIWMLSDWCKLLPWQQVARLFGVHWSTVATAVRQAVAYGLAHRQMRRVLYIGIDECRGAKDMFTSPTSMTCSKSVCCGTVRAAPRKLSELSSGSMAMRCAMGRVRDGL